MDVKSYEVTVQGFSPVLFSARTPAKARAQAYWKYTVCYQNCTFRDFLKISTIKRVSDPPGIGRRVLISGEEATVCLPTNLYGHGRDIYFMRDGQDVILRSHPLDVREINDDPEAPTRSKNQQRVVQAPV